MCTLVILRRPGHRWPLLIAANRDEMADRPWRPPGRHWRDRPEVVAGKDELAGGSWLGVNDHGVVAGVLNRRGSLGPAPHLRSRGELVLEALDHADASAAAAALSALDTASYRSFNLVIADNRDAFWLSALGPDGAPRVAIREVPPGLSMITAYDMNDRASPRIARFVDRFREADAPDPERGEWTEWQALLASRAGAAAGDDDEGAMCIVTDSGFGTVSSSLVALAAPANPPRPPIWRFAPGRPGETPYADVDVRPEPA